jgi:hypothetical protein
MHGLHDTAGGVVLVCTLVGIWLLSQVLRRGQTAGERSSTSHNASSAVRRLPARIAIFCLAWFVLAELTTEAWYRVHETKAIPSTRWTVSWPAAPIAAQTVPIDDTVEAILRYTEGRQATWRDGVGNTWQGFFFRWAPGRNSAQLASGHTPDICLRGVGCKMASDLGLRSIPVHDLRLPFHQYLFTHGLTRLHVFYCRWEDQTTEQVTEFPGAATRLSRLRAVLAGRRHLGQQALEVAIIGPDSSDDALALFESELPNIVHGG